MLGEEVPAWKTQRQAAREAAGQAYPQDGPGPEPGLPFSVNVSTRTQSPLTATTKSAIDKTAVENARVGMEMRRSHLQALVNFWAEEGTGPLHTPA